MDIVGYITTIIVVLFLCGKALFALNRAFTGAGKSATLAGAKIPEIGEGLDIGKWYDIVYSGDDFGGHFFERLQRVKIVGYVGDEGDESITKMYMQGRWLVVAFSDGRRAYILPHSIVSLQEVAPV